MMVIARIAKQEGPFWSVECDAIGAFTFGVGIEDAISMLEALVNMMVRDEGHPEFEARVIGLQIDPEDNSYNAFLESNAPALLAARVLKHQRGMQQLSLSAVAKRLGVSSRSSYANYEHGRADPSLAKFRELLAAVAPELALVIVPRPQTVGALVSHPVQRKVHRRARQRARPKASRGVARASAPTHEARKQRTR